MADEARSRLGRGLASLIGDVGGEAAHLERPRAQRKVPIEFLKPNPRNPRRAFADTELTELADSIRQHGVIQPIVVRPVKGTPDRYEIIAGERRWRAAQIAGLHDVPIVPVDVSDSDALEIAIIENVQREDLNAMEEAQGYHALAGEFKRSADEIAKIAAGKLSAGHARALIGVPDPSATAKLIIAEGLNVRQVETLVHDIGVPTRKPRTARGALVKDPDTLALEKRVGDILGLAVSVDHKGPSGTVHIKYRDLEQLEEILRRLDSKV